MLDTRSAYYADQLTEKLQLMLATKELKIHDINRVKQDDVYQHHLGFVVEATQERWSVVFKSTDEVANLNMALRFLATDMASIMHDTLSMRLTDIELGRKI